jgi:predicted ArsR family transcriptional regulator
MTVDIEVSSTDLHRIELRNPLKSQIVDYLATHGASKVSDISQGVGSSRDCIRYHLAALENASIVRSDISPGTRGRFTPFYALAPEVARYSEQNA